MKKILIILFVLLINKAFAQQYAITTNGDKVVLENDNTWYYADTDVKKTENNVQNFTSSNKPTNKKVSTVKKKKSSSRNYITGPRGGCYYINSSGKKTYVDRSLCN